MHFYKEIKHTENQSLPETEQLHRIKAQTTIKGLRKFWATSALFTVSAQ